MLIFMSIYVITTIGVFSLILQMRIRDGMVEQISDLGGLSKSNRGMAILMTMFMFSLMGIPPLLGFFGKLFAFLPAADAGLMPLVIIALIASVIGAFYYLRVIKTMWFDEEKQDFVEAPRNLRFLGLVSGLLLLPILLLPGISTGAQSLIAQAAQSLF
jgi:NADH-quinone oxidoreductase subunit N